MTLSIRDSVRDAYSAAAAQPSDSHPFPVGRSFAESIGYSIELLKGFPDDCVERFAGVSNISVTSDMPVGATVLDLGCGAGLDSMIASRHIGAQGRVVGVDFSPVMLDQARRGKSQVRIENIIFCQADAECLPLSHASIDVALVNGIFNLNPARECIFHELARVVRTGGTVHAAELILSAPLPAAEHNAANWFA